jgi:acyl carrier protein
MSDQTQDVRASIVRILVENAMVEEDALKDDAKLEDLGVDSLSLVETVFAIEEEFDIQVPFNANDPSESDFSVETVGDIVKGVEQLVSQKAV